MEVIESYCDSKFETETEDGIVNVRTSDQILFRDATTRCDNSVRPYVCSSYLGLLVFTV